MSFTAISSSRCSTPITTSAASCRSTSTTPRRAGRWRCCCAPARRRAASRSVVTCAAWSVASGALAQTRITIRGDGHYGRPEVMTWCDENGIDFVFGLPGTTPLDRLVDEVADDIRTRRALDPEPCSARLRRDKLQGEILEQRSSCRRPYRGHDARPRHPLRRHQHRDRLGRAYLPDALLRARPSRRT